MDVASIVFVLHSHVHPRIKSRLLTNMASTRSSVATLDPDIVGSKNNMVQYYLCLPQSIILPACLVLASTITDGPVVNKYRASLDLSCRVWLNRASRK